MKAHCRIFVVLARDAEVGVILRRGHQNEFRSSGGTLDRIRSRKGHGFTGGSTSTHVTFLRMDNCSFILQPNMVAMMNTTMLERRLAAC